MTEEIAPERSTEEVLCHCTLTTRQGTADEYENRCNIATTGPDDPFCEACTKRHVDDIGVKTGYIVVGQRLREREDA